MRCGPGLRAPSRHRGIAMPRWWPPGICSSDPTASRFGVSFAPSRRGTRAELVLAPQPSLGPSLRGVCASRASRGGDRAGSPLPQLRSKQGWQASRMSYNGGGHRAPLSGVHDAGVWNECARVSHLAGPHSSTIKHMAQFERLRSVELDRQWARVIFDRSIECATGSGVNFPPAWRYARTAPSRASVPTLWWQARRYTRLEARSRRVLQASAAATATRWYQQYSTRAGPRLFRSD